MIPYIDNLKHASKNSLEVIHKFSKVAGYKINIQKSVVFLYINNELSERKVKKTILFTIAFKRIKYLEINLTKKAPGYQWAPVNSGLLLTSVPDSSSGPRQPLLPQAISVAPGSWQAPANPSPQLIPASAGS